MKPIRNSTKAIIIEDGKILFTKNKDDLGVYYLLPGGGQNYFENLVDALKRECLEEISAEVEVHDLKFVRDYISGNHEFADENDKYHQVEFMFRCSLKEDQNPGVGEIPDIYQIGVEWLSIDRLHEYRIYPKALIPHIRNMESEDSKVYVGDIN